MSNALDYFKYHQIDNNSDKVLFLFHGTGGNETDLLPLVEPFKNTHTIVGLLGNVSEHDMPRFFRRYEEGLFDQENIKEETEKVSQFIESWCEKNNTTPENITYIGYSNGANFVMATMFYYPDLVKKAAFLHAMLPFEPGKLDLSHHSLFFSWGQYDTMILPQQSMKAVETLQSFGAAPTIVIQPSGHNITSYEINQLHNFIQQE